MKLRAFLVSMNSNVASTTRVTISYGLGRHQVFPKELGVHTVPSLPNLVQERFERSVFRFLPIAQFVVWNPVLVESAID